MALQRYTLDDPNPDPLNPIPQLSPAESELNEDAGDLSPEQQPTFLQSLWKNRDAIGQGLLYGANALVSYQNSVTQQENLEDRMRSTFQQKPIWDANYMYGDDQPIIKAKDGAQIRTTLDTKAAPVEIEGGEFLILPDGNLEIASGPKHSKGGVDTVLPEGTKIFSNKLKPKGSKFTFAELAKKNDYTDHKKALENPFTSQVSKRGAELMLVRKQKALENLFEDQQDMNGDSSGDEMAKGGWIKKAINPAHKGYCTPMTKSTCTPHRKALARRFKSGDLSHEEGGYIQEEFANGGTPKPMYIKDPGRPTMSDSLQLYNNSKAVLDYYKNYEVLTPPNYSREGDMYGLEIGIGNFKKSQGIVAYPNKEGKKIEGKLPLEYYHKKVDKNKFYQRETANGILDTRSPFPLYDNRIQPTAEYTYMNTKQNDPLIGDVVSIYGYDPIAVKPYSMLTPEEKKLREQRYGKPKSSAPSSTDTKKTVSSLTRTTRTVPTTPKSKPTPPAPVSEKPIQTKPWTVNGPDYWGTTSAAPTTTPSSTPAPEQKWFSIGLGNKILVDDKYMTDAEFEAHKKANPNIQFNQKPDSTGRTYKPKMEKGGKTCYECGGKMIYEEGGTYDLPKSEIERLIKLGYEIEYED